MINSSKDIIVGQFYRAVGANGYYYVGIQYGNTKRLIVVNMDQYETEDEDGDPLFPDDPYMYTNWNFEPVSQQTVMENYK
jgi:hypothetical protein